MAGATPLTVTGAPFPILPLWLSAPFEATPTFFHSLQQQLDLFVNIVLLIRQNVVAPLLEIAVWICMVMSTMLVTEKLIMGAASLYSKLFRRRPHRRYKWVPMREDLEMGTMAYPTVLVQVPMFNERQVYKLSIGAACGLSWPSDRLIVQILDDSTDPEIKDLVELECKKWMKKGINVKYEIRDNRSGYKAGALKEGMTKDYVQDCEYVAIFDADFQPESDFLLQTIPFLVHNPQIALVQARWRFVNSNECLMTRVQEMSMDYHFKVEQESGSTMHSFFGFNGTAGVWRISAIEEAGGWKDRTTVEDMDLAVRAHLVGWKFVFVGSVHVKSELPSTFRAYRSQQYRWACGPANLFRKICFEIFKTKKLSMWRKLHLVYSFFVARRVFSHIVTFMFYCIVIPTSILVPEVSVPKLGVVYIPTTITILNSVGTPSSFHLIIFWIFFENVMSLHRMRATLSGVFEVGKVNEWIVTKKLGSSSKPAKTEESMKRTRPSIINRVLLAELGMSVYLFICATIDLKYGKNHYFFYIYPQAVAFFIMGLGPFGLVGTVVPN
ncbi:cellulose synthase like [Rhynchospora pubera]|uniref:glucomannan 4-beta-mannosyltransferase n=1 Tax=Rhynchospora pubera TaxID=906938 RepID=A0AAV8HJH5_9POAL|nr:cellulose synthase like [Rhynchospora pubera]